MSRRRSALFVMLILAFPCAAALGFSGQQDGDTVTVLNADRIYYPAVFQPKKRYKKIALVDSKSIFDATPEYKQIQRLKIAKGTAEYQLLITKASNRFKRVIRKTVSLGGYDLIAETGAISVKGKTLPDITFEVIGNLD